MKKVIGIIVIILMIPVVISIIGDIDRTLVYLSTEFTIIDKPSDKQLLSNDKLLYQLPNTIEIITNELPQYVEYYEYGILEVDSGILNYTVNDNLAYLNYIEGEITQVVDGEFIVSKPTQIISKSSNLFDNEIKNFNNYEQSGAYTYMPIQLKPNTNYVIKMNAIESMQGKGYYFLINNIKSFSSGPYRTNLIYSASSSATGLETHIITTPSDGLMYFGFFSDFGVNEQSFNEMFSYLQPQLNEGTEALPYEPFGEHFYNLVNGIELYKLPNGVGDRWLQDGTLERNVGVIDTVNNYAEFGTLSVGTYDNILEFINDNQNKQIKLFFNDNIQETRYNIYLENDIIIINNDTEVIRIYNDDTYTSIRNLDTDITYKLEGYNVIGYIDGEFDNTVLAFFWIIPVLLAGGLIYLLIKRKE